MARKTIFEKLTDKPEKIRIDLEDFDQDEQNKILFGSCYIVMAKDKFLSNWGHAEGKTCYQAVICFSGEHYYNVRKSFIKDESFSHVHTYTSLDTWYESLRYKNGLICIKNARKCHAWNGEGEV